MILRFVDLFAGIGGFRLAASNSKLDGVGFEAVASCEIDATCRRIYEGAFSTLSGDETSIEDVYDIRVRKSERGMRQLPAFDVLFAGFPCQAFSNVGTRKGFDDHRGILFFSIIDILRYYRPSFFILENVQKIVTMEKGRVLGEIVAALEACNYHVHVWQLSADKYGLPQKRLRLFFCGVSKSRSAQKRDDLAPPAEIPQGQWRYPTAWHLLERTMDPAHLLPAKTRETVLRPNPKWMGDLQIDRAIARPLTATMAKWHRANQDNYYSATYVSAANKNPFASPNINLAREPIRRITPLEGLRLQGFPDRYAGILRELKITYTPAYRVIGNAVPVDLAKSVIDHFIGSYL